MKRVKVGFTIADIGENDPQVRVSANYLKSEGISKVTPIIDSLFKDKI